MLIYKSYVFYMRISYNYILYYMDLILGLVRINFIYIHVFIIYQKYIKYPIISGWPKEGSYFISTMHLI